MKFLITGASGLLGKKMTTSISNEHTVIGTGLNNIKENMVSMDLHDFEQIKQVFDDVSPDVVIHTAALTNVNYCEQNPREAKLVNSDATLFLAKLCKANQTKMVYISTDYVFDGATGPYYENSTPYPVQIYGFTKYLGEAVLNASDNNIVARIGILHGYNDELDKETFTRGIINGEQASDKIALDDHRIKYPTLIDDVSGCIKQLVHNDAKGIFHLAGPDGVTRFQWAKEIAEVFSLDPTRFIPDKEMDQRNLSKLPRDIQLVNSRHSYRFSNLRDSLNLIKNQMSE